MSSCPADRLMAALTSSLVVSRFDDELEIDDGNVRRRHADGRAVEPALEFRQDEADGLGGAGRGRDHRHGRSAAAVEILVQGVEGRLIARIGVDRRHEAFVDADESFSTLATGARQLVVHEAFETTRWSFVSLSWLTP